MKNRAYGKPVLITSDSVSLMNKVEAKDEASIQDIVFRYPECLPISDIDEAYNPVIPIATELNTPAGPLDVFLVTPGGELIIVEMKLWRNPEARRVAVAQILDYAKELMKWTYDDLQREVNRRNTGNRQSLYEMVSKQDSPYLVSEEVFFDSVSRNLRNGKFLLLLVGDGIREGALGLAEFLDATGHFSFTFAMVELSIYEHVGVGSVVLPRVIAKTVDIPRVSVDLADGLILSRSETNGHSDTENQKSTSKEDEERRFYRDFWNEFVKGLDFDDPGQPLPQLATAQNLFIHPSPNKRIWISAYFMKSKKRVGVYFRCQKDIEGQELYELLGDQKEDIRKELGVDVVWSWESGEGAGFRMPCEDVFDPLNREAIKDFFQDKLNLMVNVLRPRLKNL